MAKLLIRTVEAENSHRYDDGDVVAVLPDNHVFGRLESKEVWIAEGLDPDAWPGGFAIVEVNGAEVSDFMHCCDESADKRRANTIDYRSLEQRVVGGGRDTLNIVASIRKPLAAVMQSVRSKG